MENVFLAQDLKSLRDFLDGMNMLLRQKVSLFSGTTYGKTLGAQERARLPKLGEARELIITGRLEK